jgi:hypothetical protein
MFEKAFQAAKCTCTAVLLASFATAAYAQDLCPHKLLDRDMIVNLEGWFINAEHSRARIDLEWRHHEKKELDTFFVHIPNRPMFKYITSSTGRYVEFSEPKIKRQMAMHHLKEDIANTPVKYDDLELLAHGFFACKDSSVQKPNILSPAYSNMWWSATVDSLENPRLVTMRGAAKEKRELRIDSWKDFSGIKLPALVTVANLNYRGKLWVRSVYPVEEIDTDPLRENILKSGHDYRTFWWIGNEK